jgi:hypothetical protein
MKIFVLVAAVCLAASAHSQFRVGLSYGAHFSMLGKENNRNGKPLFRPQLGITCDIPLYRSFLLQADASIYPIGYSRSNIMSNIGSLKTVYMHRITYLQLPVHLLYRVKIGKTMILKAGAGPFIAFPLSAVMDVKINRKETGLPAYVEKITPELKGMSFQLGYQRKDFFLSLRWQMSLNDLYTNSDHVVYNNWRMNSGGISFGFLLPKGKIKKKNPRKRSGIFPS